MTPHSLSLHIAVPVRGEPVIPIVPGPSVDIDPDAVVDHEVLVPHAGHMGPCASTVNPARSSRRRTIVSLPDPLLVTMRRMPSCSLRGACSASCLICSGRQNPVHIADSIAAIAFSSSRQCSACHSDCSGVASPGLRRPKRGSAQCNRAVGSGIADEVGGS